MTVTRLPQTQGEVRVLSAARRLEKAVQRRRDWTEAERAEFVRMARKAAEKYLEENRS